MPSDRDPAIDAGDSLVTGKLTSEETAQLGGQLAQLAKSGLPLAPGLRAMAEELPMGAVSRMLRQLAAELDAGRRLDAALEVQGPRFPAHLRGLILTGVRSGRLAETFEEFVTIQRNRIEQRRRLWMILAYPLFLVLMLLGLFVFFSMVITPMLTEMVASFEFRSSPLTVLLGHMTSPAAALWVLGISAGLAVAAILTGVMRGKAAWAQDLCYNVPVLGPLWRWGRLAEFSRLMGVLLEQQVPLPTALRLTADGLGDPSLAAGCRRLAELVAGGAGLADSLPRVRQFPASLRPIVQWGQQIPALPEAFRAAAEMYEGRARSQAMFLEVILLPLVLLLVLVAVSLLLFGVMLPIVMLIRYMIWW